MTEEDLDLCFRFLTKYLSRLDTEILAEIYEDNKEEIDQIFEKESPLKKEYQRLKHYFKSGIYVRFIDEELYLFNARYSKKEVGVSKNGKKLYEEVLDIEKLIKFNPFKDSNIIQMMKMRANIQGDLKTYQLWVSKGLFGGKEDVHVTDEDIIELIDQRKVPI
jgi:hypothetical protein